MLPAAHNAFLSHHWDGEGQCAECVNLARLHMIDTVQAGNVSEHKEVINLAAAHFCLKQYADCWQVLEKRRRTTASVILPQDLSGQTVRVTTEQGFGDTILYARYLWHVQQRGARVVLQAQPALKMLLRGLCGPHGEPLDLADAGAADHEVSLLSLPWALQMFDPADSWYGPYLKPDQACIDKWYAWVEAHLQQRRIGVAWQGSTTYSSDIMRSMPLAYFSHLLADETSLVSLQRGASPEAQLTPWLTNTGADASNKGSAFVDTIALIANLDLVISVDTAVLHLAGAMGKPVYSLTALLPHWHNGLTGEASLWYPAERLFRQPTFGDWTTVMTRISSTLTGPQCSPGL